MFHITIHNTGRIIISAALMACLMMTASVADAVKDAPKDKDTPTAEPTDKKTAPKTAKKLTGNKVSFNFVDVDITKVAEFISDLTGKNFIFDERVKGKVTIMSPTGLKKNEAYNLFTSVLQLKGFALVPSGVGAFKIVPAAEVKQSGLKVSNKRRPFNEDYIVRLIQLEHISSTEGLSFLQPLISRNGYISSFGPGNMILVIDSGLNLEKLLKIVQNIDRPSHHEEPEVIPLMHSDAQTLVSVLNQGTGKSTVRRKGTPAAKTASKAVADKRLNAVVLFGSKANKDAMKRLITLLDIPTDDEMGSINVYFLENADADEMAKVLQGMVSKAKSSSARKTASRPGTPSGKSTGGTSPFQSASGLSITPDKASNALVIIGSPTDYASLVEIIKKLDRRRKQVYVEALIVEASVDNLREMGSKWRGAASYDNNPVIIGGVGSMDASAMQEVVSGMAGMSVGGMTQFVDVDVTTIDPSTGLPITDTLSIPGFAALFSMSEFEGVVNILSSPQILTTNNTEAEIHVGENVPFVTKTETTTSTNPIKSIERKDVGISLKITPQITEGDYVKLDIYQEISSVKESSEKIITEVGPTTTTRHTKTEVIVKDKHTVVISGLMQDRVIEGETRVPLLHRIPLLGWLFKFKTSSHEKINLLVFLTPHIVRNAEEMQALTAQKSESYARAEAQYVEGQLLVKFKEDVSEERTLEIIKREKAVAIQQLSDGGLYHLQLHRKMDVEEGIEEFGDYKEVEFAEPNFRMKALHKVHGINNTSVDLILAPDSASSTGQDEDTEASRQTDRPLGTESWDDSPSDESTETDATDDSGNNVTGEPATESTQPDQQ